MISIAVTGHRPDKLWGYDLSHPNYEKLEHRLMLEIANIWDKKAYPKFAWQMPIECITGMALGVDIVFAKAVIKMREVFYSIRLIAAVPCLNQDKLWRIEDKRAYAELLKRANEVVYVSDTSYTDACMTERNQYMINRCDVLLAVWNGDKHGGTADAINRAHRAKKEIIYLNPNDITKETENE